jgi:hypothetical protein
MFGDFTVKLDRAVDRENMNSPMPIIRLKTWIKTSDINAAM